MMKYNDTSEIYIFYSCNEWKDYSSMKLIEATTDKDTLYAAIGNEIFEGRINYRGETKKAGFLDFKRDFNLDRIDLDSLEYGFVAQKENLNIKEMSAASEYSDIFSLLHMSEDDIDNAFHSSALIKDADTVLTGIGHDSNKPESENHGDDAIPQTGVNMQDLEHSGQVKWWLDTIKNAVESYEKDPFKIYFDYKGVIDLLEQAQILVDESARCPRPAELPDYMAWDERLYDGDEVSDGYIFHSGMSAEDYGIMCDNEHDDEI